MKKNIIFLLMLVSLLNIYCEDETPPDSNIPVEKEDLILNDLSLTGDVVVARGSEIFLEVNISTDVKKIKWTCDGGFFVKGIDTTRIVAWKAPVVDFDTLFVIEVIVYDSFDNFDRAVAGITVLANSFPSIDIILEKKVAYPSDTVNFEIRYFDDSSNPEITILSTGGSIVYERKEKNILGYWIAPDIQGEYMIETKISDGVFEAKDTAIIAVATNNPPIITIVSPEEGDSFSITRPVNFVARASDIEDGNLIGVSIVWISEEGTPFGIGESFSYSFESSGWKKVFAYAYDRNNAFSLDSTQFFVYSNRSPIVKIKSPVKNSSFLEGTSINLQGDADDPEDGQLNNYSILWYSSLDGFIGTGKLVTGVVLSIGNHILKLIGIDRFGAIGADSININIKFNNPPQVTILSPPQGTQVIEGDLLNFIGKATDNEDGVLPDVNLEWNSSLDGAIGKGDSISVKLSGGRHQITLKAKDSKGKEGSDDVLVAVVDVRRVPEEYYSINQAIQSSDLGDIIVVSPGIYEENITIDKDITLRGANPLSTIIKGKGSQKVIRVLSSCTIERFKIMSYNFNESAIYVESGDAEIRHNIITANLTGIYIYGNSNALIKNNIIWDNNDIGIRVAGTSNVKIINNTIHKNKHGGIYVNPPAVAFILNNIISFNGVNINDFGGIKSLVKSTYIDYNNWYKNEPQDKEGGTIGQGNIGYDPKFVDPDNGDFHLTKFSKAINRGDPSEIYNDVDGTRNDMGCYGGPSPFPY